MTNITKKKLFENPNTNTGGGSFDLTPLINRINILENNEYKITYFTEINSSTGTVTIPTGATIETDQFTSGADALVSKIQNNQPNGELPETSSGTKVDVSSFDSLGNFTLTGIPNSFPIALIYTLRINSLNYSNLVYDNILEFYKLNEDKKITGDLIFNFSNNEEDTIVNTILNGNITTNIKNFTIIPKETIETSLDDFNLNGLKFNIENIINNTSFDIRATAENNASGNYTINYIITY
jgi:hypothetical protein